MGAAAAEMRLQRLQDVRAGRLRGGPQECGRRHEDAGEAEAALAGLMGDDGGR